MATGGKQIIKLDSGSEAAGQNFSFMVRPFVDPQYITYDYNQSTGTFSKQDVLYDMTAASMDDILYTSSTFSSVQNPYKRVSGVLANFANNTEVRLGAGADVVVGGALRDQILGGDTIKGSKVLIGGSYNDLIRGGSDADYIVGDYHAGYADAFYNPKFEVESTKNISDASIDDSRFASQNALIQATGLERDPVGTSGRNNRAKKALDGYTYNKDYWDPDYAGGINAQYGNFIKQRQYLLGPGSVASASTSIRPNLWQPYGDTLIGGPGDDVIFGDDDSWTGQDLINYKTNFGDTLDAINNWQSYYQINEPWKTIEEKTSTGAVPTRILGELKTPVWRSSDPVSATQRRLRLGDDEIYGGEGDDVIFGGIGADMIVGGKGFDVIYAPAQILVPGYDPLWGEASVFYGDDFSAVYDDKTGLPVGAFDEDQLFIRRYGYNSQTDKDNPRNWANVLKPSPDLFVIDSPIWNEAELQRYSENFGEISRNLSTLSVNDRDNQSRSHYGSLIAEKVTDTVLDIAGAIPVVGDAIGLISNLFKRLIDWPSPPENPKVINSPDTIDKNRVIRDFSIWDSIVVTASGTDGVKVNDSSSINTTVSIDAAIYRNGYKPLVSTNFADATIDLTSKYGTSTIVLGDYSFEEATNSFVKSLKELDKLVPNDITGVDGDDGLNPTKGKLGIFNVNVTDPVTQKVFAYPYQRVKLLKPIGDSSKGVSYKAGQAVTLAQAIDALGKSWGGVHYDQQKLTGANNGFDVYKISHRLFSTSDAGENVNAKVFADLGFDLTGGFGL